MSHFKMEINLKKYLHEKAQESRQNEFQAWMMFVAGTLFFVGGVLTNLRLIGDPEWFLFIPYHSSLGSGAVLGLSLIISGLCLIVLGIIRMLYYRHERAFFMEESRKVYESEMQKKELMQKREFNKAWSKQTK